MACHYHETGHTKPIVGAIYVRWLQWSASWNQYRLKSFNPTTGIATLIRDGNAHFVLLSELSRWHMIKEGT